MDKFNPEVFRSLLCKDLQQSDSLPLTSDLSVSDVRKSQLLSALFKKLEPSGDRSSLERNAIEGFMASNARCQTFSVVDDGSYHFVALEYMRDAMYKSYHSAGMQTALFGLSDILGKGLTGPGASVGTRATDFVGKLFNSALSSTSKSLYLFYLQNLSPRWLTANENRSHRYGSVSVVRGSKLSTVPKNDETDRCICTEPSLNMFFQRGAGEWLCEMLIRDHNIDLSNQPDVNRSLARRGSVDGSFATIDLKSASDSISTELVKWLLPRQLYALLACLRSERVTYKGNEHELFMFSTMGNGFTFPLQTWIFAESVRQAYVLLGIKPVAHGPNRNYGVFGDDIVCYSSAYSTVVRILQLCGFIVNDDKSFTSGVFRESCGGDFFRGFDVRGLYFKKRDSHATTIYSYFNRLARWSAKNGITCVRSLDYLVRLAPFRPVPFDEGDSAGFKIPSRYLVGRKRDVNGALYYTALTSRAQKHRFTRRCYDPASDSHCKVMIDDALYDAVVIALCGGYVRNGHAMLRPKSISWKVVRRKTPCWDFVPDAGLAIRDFTLLFDFIDWQRA